MSSTETREGMQGVDKLRLAVEESLAGIAAVREGTLDTFPILGPEDRAIMVTSETADEIEDSIRESVAERYPDLAVRPQDERTPGIRDEILEYEPHGRLEMEQ
jgi:hypothetical protein